MKNEDNGDSFIIWLSKRDTHLWAMKRWPGCELGGRRLRADFDANGLLDFKVDGRHPGSWLHIPADELNACLADHIEGKLPNDHPCYFVACGQFLEQGDS